MGSVRPWMVDDRTDAAVTVVIVTYQSEEVVGECLDALPAALENVPYRVVVADNDSSDRSLSIVTGRCPDATICRVGRNAGFAAGINTALDSVGLTPAVLVLNPDVRLRPGSVPALLDTLADGRGVGIAVPRTVDGNGDLQLTLRREPTVLRALGDGLLGGTRAGRIEALGETVVDRRAYDRPTVADWATGAALLISKACLLAVGRWDESYFLYSEETDFALRARDLGFSVQLVPEAAAVHLGGESKTSPRLWALLTTNRVRLFRRRHGPVRSAAFHSVVVLNEALRAPRAKTHRAALVALLSGSNDRMTGE